jgi:hypothetical protein
MSIKVIGIPMDIRLLEANEKKKVLVGVVPNGSDVSKIQDEDFFCFLTMEQYFSVCNRYTKTTNGLEWVLDG